jgi:hypothetical protein
MFHWSLVALVARVKPLFDLGTPLGNGCPVTRDHPEKALLPAVVENRFGHGDDVVCKAELVKMSCCGGHLAVEDGTR